MGLFVPDKIGLAQDGRFGHHLEEKISEGVCFGQLKAQTRIGEKLGQPKVEGELLLVVRWVPGMAKDSSSVKIESETAFGDCNRFKVSKN